MQLLGGSLDARGGGNAQRAAPPQCDEGAGGAGDRSKELSARELVQMAKRAIKVSCESLHLVLL
jgi:hypothetical protein